MSWLHLCTRNTITHDDGPSDTPPPVQRTIKALFRISLHIDSWVLFSIFAGVQMLSTFPLKSSEDQKKELCFKKTCQRCYLAGRHKQTHRSKTKYQDVLFVLRRCKRDKMLYYLNIPLKYLIIYSYSCILHGKITNTKAWISIKNDTLPTVYINAAAIIE